MQKSIAILQLSILFAATILPEGLGWILCPTRGTVNIYACCNGTASADDSDCCETSCCEANESAIAAAIDSTTLQKTCCRPVSEKYGYATQQAKEVRIDLTANAVYRTPVAEQFSPTTDASQWHPVTAVDAASPPLFQVNCALLT
jgi:hypothetical protein